MEPDRLVESFARHGSGRSVVASAESCTVAGCSYIVQPADTVHSYRWRERGAVPPSVFMIDFTTAYPNSRKIFESRTVPLVPDGPMATVQVPMREVTLGGGEAPVLLEVA